MEGSDQAHIRRNAIQTLNELLGDTDEIPDGNIAKDLIHIQNRFLKLHPSSEQGRNWLKMQIEDKWKALIQEGSVDEKQEKMVLKQIEALRKSCLWVKTPSCWLPATSCPNL